MDDLESVQEQLDAVLEAKHSPSRSELQELLKLVKRAVAGVGNLADPADDFVYDASMVCDDVSSDTSSDNSESSDDGSTTTDESE